MPKEDLLNLLDTAFINMKPSLKRHVFSSVYFENTKHERTPKKLWESISQFSKDSMAGLYYAPFDMNSKNFMDIPEETEEWFDKLGLFLDFSSHLVDQGHYQDALRCFKELFMLIYNMTEEIVFADELGYHMIIAETDYLKAFAKAASTLPTLEEYTDNLLQAIKIYGSNPHYQLDTKIKAYASTEQLKALNDKKKTP